MSHPQDRLPSHIKICYELLTMRAMSAQDHTLHEALKTDKDKVLLELYGSNSLDQRWLLCHRTLHRWHQDEAVKLDNFLKKKKTNLQDPLTEI